MKYVYIVFDRAGFIIAIFANKEKMLAPDAVKGVDQSTADEPGGPAADSCFWERHEIVY